MSVNNVTVQLMNVFMNLFIYETHDFIRMLAWMGFKWQNSFNFLLIKHLPVTIKLEHTASVLQNKERHTHARR
jgi:hypothetical protein